MMEKMMVEKLGKGAFGHWDKGARRRGRDGQNFK
jgi:hypothetical protein